jgi:hypothetical protein
VRVISPAPVDSESSALQLSRATAWHPPRCCQYQRRRSANPLALGYVSHDQVDATHMLIAVTDWTALAELIASRQGAGDGCKLNLRSMRMIHRTGGRVGSAASEQRDSDPECSPVRSFSMSVTFGGDSPSTTSFRGRAENDSFSGGVECNRRMVASA